MSWASTDTSLVGLRELYQRVVTVIEAQTVAVASSYVIDHSGNTPSHLVDDTFSVDLQTANTGKYREDTAIRMGHELAVVLVRKLAPGDQASSYVEALQREEEIIRALMERVATVEIRVVYRSTSRALSPSREYLVSRLVCGVEHDWYSQPLSPSPEA